MHVLSKSTPVNVTLFFVLSTEDLFLKLKSMTRIQLNVSARCQHWTYMPTQFSRPKQFEAMSTTTADSCSKIK
jgi:hypothetical protein